MSWPGLLYAVVIRMLLMIVSLSMVILETSSISVTLHQGPTTYKCMEERLGAAVLQLVGRFGCISGLPHVYVVIMCLITHSVCCTQLVSATNNNIGYKGQHYYYNTQLHYKYLVCSILCAVPMILNFSTSLSTEGLSFFRVS